MHKQIILKCPEHIKPFRNNKKTISIDEGIVKVIKALWKNKIITLGCCIGGDGKMASIIIGNDYKEKDLDKIEKIVNKNYDDCIELLQWKIVPVSTIYKGANNGFLIER